MSADEPPSIWFNDNWYAQVPLVHRHLAGDTSVPFQLRPNPCDYWFAAYYLCRAILGWADCGRGVQQLHDPLSLDGPARILGDGWRDRLDALGLWAWVTGEEGVGDNQKRPSRSFGSEKRVRRAEALTEAFGFTGGYDPLHLSHIASVEGALSSEPGDATLDSVTQDHRVVLFVDRADEWPRSLRALGSGLGGAQPPSWRVDIVSRRDGHLGQWRRCWECRRWFQGRAQFHKLGHAQPSS